MFNWMILLMQTALTPPFPHRRTQHPGVLNGDVELAYASVYMITMFATANVIFGVASMTVLWSAAVLLVCLGILLPRHNVEMSLLTSLGAGLRFVATIWRGTP